MRSVLQRVTQASVKIEGQVVAEIQSGLLILLGIERGDDTSDLEWMLRKIPQQRLFEDEAGKMNLSLVDVAGEALVVSQFTLHARTRKGTRPSFDRAAPPDEAVPLYEAFLTALSAQLGRPVPSGTFGAMMQVSLVNDGPVTLILDSRLRE